MLSSIFFCLCIFFIRVGLDITKYDFFRIYSEIYPPAPAPTPLPSPSPHTLMLQFYFFIISFFSLYYMMSTFYTVDILNCRRFTLSTFFFGRHLIFDIFLSTFLPSTFGYFPEQCYQPYLKGFLNCVYIT